MILGDPWFVASDLARALGYSHAPHMARVLHDDEKGVHIVDTPGGPQEMNIISESGMYAAVFKSRREEAERFRKWVTSVVLPSIRKTGSFEMPGYEPPPQIALDHDPIRLNAGVAVVGLPAPIVGAVALFSGDNLAEPLKAWLEDKTETTAVWAARGIGLTDIDRMTTTRISALLRLFGWVRHESKRDGVKVNLCDIRSSRDQEDKANVAVGAMVYLISGQASNTMIDAEPLANLLDLVFSAARDAIPNGWPKHGRAVNDEDHLDTPRPPCWTASPIAGRRAPTRSCTRWSILMAQEQIYQPQIVPGNTAGIPLAQPQDFGAGVGQGIGQLGGALEQGKKIDRQLRADEQATTAASNLARVRLALDEQRNAARANAAPLAAGHAQAMADSFDAATQDITADITDTRVRRSIEAQIQEQRASFVGNEDAWQAATAAKESVGNIRETGNRWSAFVRTSADPDAYVTATKAIDGLVDSQQGIGEYREPVRRELHAQLAIAAVQRLQDTNPRAAAASLDSGHYNDVLD
ncbi:hypothetical protein EMGR_006137, partial [Emarellia grisea]